MDAILLAVRNNSTNLSNALAKHSPNGEEINRLYDGRSLLSWASSRVCLKNVKVLLELGADVNLAGLDGRLPLDYVCGSENRNDDVVDIVELLLRSGADIDGRDNMGRSALLRACEADDARTVQFLVERGCNVNALTVCGESPMKIACKNAEFWFYWNGHRAASGEARIDPRIYPPVKIVKSLLRAGADRREATILPTVVQFNCIDLVVEFLELGMDVNMLDNSRRTPLGCACSTVKVSPSTVALLLNRGADVNKAGGWKKQKPVILAYVHNALEKVRLLLSKGASVTADEMTNLVSVTLSKAILENPEVVGPLSRELAPWRLLLSSGFRPSINASLTAKMEQLRMCSSYELISPWINDFLYPVLPLRELCRVVIRDSLPVCKDENVNRLPLPRRLREYLQFADFKL